MVELITVVILTYEPSYEDDKSCKASKTYEEIEKEHGIIKPKGFIGITIDDDFSSIHFITLLSY
jgi:hypothetical protein